MKNFIPKLYWPLLAGLIAFLCFNMESWWSFVVSVLWVLILEIASREKHIRMTVESVDTYVAEVRKLAREMIEESSLTVKRLLSEIDTMRQSDTTSKH